MKQKKSKKNQKKNKKKSKKNQNCLRRPSLNHIGWATSMPLHQSILLTQEPIHKIFTKKYRELAELKNSVFLSRPFWFFFWFFFDFFCFIPMKISHKLCVRMDGTQFLLLWWLTAKNEGGNHIIAWVYQPTSQWCIWLNMRIGMHKENLA